MRLSGNRLSRLALLGLSMGLLAACVPAPAETPAAALAPALPGKVVKYTCDGGSHLTVTYGAGTVILPGNETLLAEEGSANRYSWPSDGTHHVWTLAGEIGTLALHDGAKGTETIEKTGCKPDA